MGDNFKDKVVLVTGSGQGVGRAIALAFGEEGAIVITNNRKPGSTRLVTMTDEAYEALDPAKRKEFDDLYAGISGDAETTAQTIIDRGGRAMPIYCDIGNMAEAEKMVQKIVDTYGTIHCLVNVAGAFGGGELTDISEELWDRVNTIKPKGYFNVMKFVLPHMVKQQWGRIVNCTSRAMMGDIGKYAHYCAANAGVAGLTQGAACEYFHEGITVNGFSPWARTRAAYEGDFRRSLQDESAKGSILAVTPDPEAVAPFVMYLCTEDAAKITGTIFQLAGNEIGMHQYPTPSRALKKYGEGYLTVDYLKAHAPRALFKGYSTVLDVQ